MKINEGAEVSVIDRDKFQNIKESGLRLSDDDIEHLLYYVELGIEYEKTLNRIKHSSVREFQKWQSEQEENGKEASVYDYFSHLASTVMIDN